MAKFPLAVTGADGAIIHAMASLITHPVVALGCFPWFRKRIGKPAVLAIGAALTGLPDADVAGFAFGIGYSDLLGHRGLTHSLPFALVLGGLVALAASRAWRLNIGVLWLYFALCLASHGVLDALTNGGLGVAFFSPFSNERYFFDFRPLQVSSISVARFFAHDWIGLLAIEFRWIWTPMLALGAAGMLVNRLRGATAEPLDSKAPIAEALSGDKD